MTVHTMVRRLPVVGVAILLVASPLTAQAPDQPGTIQGMGRGMGMMQMMGGGMMGPGMMQMMNSGMGMMPTGGPSPAMILRMGEALGLTDEQRTQLEDIQAEYSQSAQPQMMAMMESHQAARVALEGESPDLEAYEEALREGSDRMIEARVAMARAATRARSVLTDAQREQLESGMQMMQGMTGQGGPGTMDQGAGTQHEH